MGTYDVAVNQMRIRYGKAPPREMNRGRRFSVNNTVQAVQRPVISEPSTFSLSAFGPRVTATAPERTSSITP